ncbi:MAG: hypothetical protein DMF77_17010, partial [Acidobacteria bacterium]
MILVVALLDSLRFSRKGLVPADRWQRVKELLGAALERPAEAREAFLRQACGEDEGLRHEVELLLAARREADPWSSSFTGSTHYCWTTGVIRARRLARSETT